MSDASPMVPRALLRLHRFLLARFPERFPAVWADATHETTRDLVRRALGRGPGAATRVALAECLNVLWLGVGAWAAAPAGLLQDVAHGLRRLRAHPVRALSVVMMLAVGIGASTGVFSAVDATLLRPMMLRDVGRLVRIDDVTPDGAQASNVSPMNADRLLERSMTLDPVIVQDYRPFVLSGGAEPERLRGAGVSEGWATGLGVQPMLGRGFAPGEYRAGTDAEAVLVSWDLWQRRWGGTVDVLGSVAVLNDRPRTVVGVMPRGFHFPYEADLWVPIDYEPTAAAPHYLLVFARMAPHRSLADVQRELDAMSSDLRAAAPAENRDVTLHAMPLRDNLVRGYDRTALALLSVVGFLLLVGAVNVASLGLAEALARAREMAIRASLGATRRRQIVQLLAESGTLVVLGGALGLGIAVLLRPLLSLLVPPVKSVELAQNEITLNSRVLIFAFGASTVAALVSGVLPALRAAVRDPAAVLRAGAAIGRQGRARAGLSLVGVELALAMVLITGASAVTASFVRDQARPLGYRAEGLLTLHMSLPEDRYAGDERRGELVERLRARLAGLPGVASATVVTGNPALGAWVESASSAERPDPADAAQTYLRFVSRDFFTTLDVRLVAGRALDARDDAGPPSVVVSRTLARTLWGDETSALGRSLLMPQAPAGGAAWTVVGVCDDLREQTRAAAAAYVPYTVHRGRFPAQEIDFFVRTAEGAPGGLAPEVRAAIHEVDATLALSGVRLQIEVRSVEESLARAGATLAAGLVAFGLLLSGIGVFGVVSNVSARASRAMGVRKALGASGPHLLIAALAPSLQAVAAGLGGGAAAAWLIHQVLAMRVVGLPAPDFPLYVGTAVVLAGVALAAALGPAVGVARVDPARALRSD